MLGFQRFTRNVSLQIMHRIVSREGWKRMSNTAAAASQGANTNESVDQSQDISNKNKSRGSLVEAAFQSLKDNSSSVSKDSVGEKAKLLDQSKSKGLSIEDRITNAKTVNGLLSIVEIQGTLSRQQALQIVSILAEWSTMNKVRLVEFENDARFLKICRLLGKTFPKSDSTEAERRPKQISGFRTDDLNTVLGVAGDDEAAKLIASISLPQMVKVMSTLAHRKRRSTPLLRSLAFNISSATEQLDIKQCADVLFAMSSLNFQDSVLSAKLCADIQLALTKNIEKSAVIGSILTSLGILKYRDLDIMEAITQWVLKNHEVCRPQDLSSYVLTSAMLNFKSCKINDINTKFLRTIIPEDFKKKVDWLNHVWALSILGLVSNEQLEVVLKDDFIKCLEAQQMLTPTAKMRLLNLSSYAKLMANNYTGTNLTDDSSLFNVPMGYVKSKQTLVNSMLDTLKSLIPNEKHVKSLENSKMGFLIDAVCHFDSKRNPLPLDKSTPDAIRVAIMVVDFHDVCHGTHRCASGVTTLHFDLLEKAGYTVLPVPYNEFNISDKLLKRVQYIDSKFKALINTKV